MARLLIDMDGVLADLVTKWFRTYNEEYDDAIAPEMMKEWGPHKVAKAGRSIYKYLGQPGFFRDLEPLPGAIDGVRALLDRGHEIVIVTAAKNGHRDKLEWVWTNLPFLPRDNVIFAHRKELVRGDILFDDAPHNLEAFSAYGTPVAMAYPYNEGVPYSRVDSWPAFVDLVDRTFAPKEPVASTRKDRISSIMRPDMVRKGRF